MNKLKKHFQTYSLEYIYAGAMACLVAIVAIPTKSLAKAYTDDLAVHSEAIKSTSATYNRVMEAELARLESLPKTD